MDTQEIPTPTDPEAQREIALRTARATARIVGSVEAARARITKTLDDYPTLPAKVRDELGRVLEALDGTYGPVFPAGTPEYEQYARDLRTELGRWSRREAQYN